MKILMVTNTYTPIVGGVERSIISFTKEFRRRGHEVMVLAPEFDDIPENEQNVIRVSALRRFNGSDFSVRIPIPTEADRILKDFRPDIVHSHHPFLLGDTALRIASKHQVPLVFTHHTKYEDYTHYVPVNSKMLKKFVIELSSGYGDLADHVIAPSQSIKDLIESRGVKTPVSVIPTGVDFDRFSKGDGRSFRAKSDIPENAFVIGHVGRLAEEKNLKFLVGAVAAFLKEHEDARFLLVGKGPLEKAIRSRFESESVADRVVMPGVLDGQNLIDAYHAMDVFAFSSVTETQGMVLTEAMAAGNPVVAIDATGVREVVKDKVNGRMLPNENVKSFVEGLNWVYSASDNSRRELVQEAVQTAKDLSLHNTAQSVLDVYESLLSKDFTFVDIDESPWAHALERIKTEWDLLSNMADAVGSMMNRAKPKDHYNQSTFVRLQRWLNSNEWTAKLLGLSHSQQTEAQNGLILIQIDGLSHQEFKEALKKGYMPLMQRLLRKEHYRLYSMYSGQPSSTPGVQAELFYGVKGAVPSFSFLDSRSRQVFKMFDDDAAIEIENRLKEQGEGLLSGGSSYSNVYSGGAKETHFCSVDLGWDKLWRSIKPIKMVLLVLIHFYSIILTSLRMMIELFLSLVDFMRGLILGKNIIKELKFIPTRLGICILLRDLITFGVKIDAIRGLPIIHCNFLGYDEHAHRRGPLSKFARWTLPGIDRAISKIYREAMRSTRRNYDVWIYSDHGQEENRSYTAMHNTTVHESVREVFKDFDLEENFIKYYDEEGIQSQRFKYIGSKFLDRFIPIALKRKGRLDPKSLVVTAMGPIGHIYLPVELNNEQLSSFAKELVAKAEIPLVFAANRNGVVRAWNSTGEYVLPQEAANVFGADHPFLNEVTADIMHTVTSAQSGTFTISGWVPDGKPISFPLESGSHGGPGVNESNGFAILPADISVKDKNREYIRPIELRDAAINFMRPTDAAQQEQSPSIAVPGPAETKRIRIITYNVHGCKGLDGKVSPQRIARILARHNPDIIALQELDMNRQRSGTVDQPHLIAKQLEMMHQFHPAMVVEEEQYGNAVLSRFPMTLKEAKPLAGFDHKARLEPRGAIWVEVDVNGSKIQFFNTHLGLSGAERLVQVSDLLGENWIGSEKCRGPVVLCGDFNAIARSKVCQNIQQKLIDAQIGKDDHKPKPTWFSRLPVSRIDHVFVSEQFEIDHVDVSQTKLDRVASDHLPLIVDLKLKERNVE